MTHHTDYKNIHEDIAYRNGDWRDGWDIRYQIKSALWMLFGLGIGLAIGLNA